VGSLRKYGIADITVIPKVKVHVGLELFQASFFGSVTVWVDGLRIYRGHNGISVETSWNCVPYLSSRRLYVKTVDAGTPVRLQMHLSVLPNQVVGYWPVFAVFFYYNGAVAPGGWPNGFLVDVEDNLA